MIEYYSPHKKIWIKTIASLLVVTFIWYDIAWAGDLFYMTARPAGSVVQNMPKEVTNYDQLSYDQKESIARKLMPTSQEAEQTGKFAPGYVQEQQQKHEDIIKQKQDTEDLLWSMQNALRKKLEAGEEDEWEMQRKRGSGQAGEGMPIGYTLTDWDQPWANAGSRPGQINVYKYDGKVLKEVVSYDLSGLDTGGFQSGAKEIETKEGDKIFGSYNTPDMLLLTPDRILSKTIYFGAASSEQIAYILSGYREDNKPSKITVYDYGKVGGDSLDETRTYDLEGLNFDYENCNESSLSGWKPSLTKDRLVNTSAYEGGRE